MRLSGARMILLSALIVVLTTACGHNALTTNPVQPGHASGERDSKVQTARATVELVPQATDSMRCETFVDTLHGWVVVGQRILKTADGGDTWSKVSPVDGKVYDIGFVSAQHGWLFTADGLKITEDGGRTWRSENVPHVGGITLRQVQFADEKHGWILGTGEGPFIPDPHNPGSGTIPSIIIFWSTADGGRTWSRMDVPAKIADNEFGGYCYFSFVSPQEGWLLVGTQPGTGQQGKFLYRTMDGGRDWTEVTSVGFYGPPQPKNGLPGGGYITGLDFLNSRVGWLTEDRGFVCLTTDGGRSWKALGKYSELNERGLLDPDFLDADHGYVISGNVLMATSDGGVTWRQVYPGLWPTPELVLPGLKACFFNAMDAVAAIPGAILTTEDGGFSWRKTGSVPGNGYIIDFSFPDAQHGWVITEGFSGVDENPVQRTIYRTSDAGLTWQLLAKTTDLHNLYADVSFVDDNTGFVASGWGHLWVTHDGGRTLEVVDGTDSTASRFQFISSTEGWKMQDHGLYATADGGRTWRRILLDVAVANFDLVTARSAWVITASSSASGYHPKLLSTTDDGASWTAYDLGSVNPTGVAFADSNHGWLVDNHGNRYYTGDGGHTWQEVDPYED